MVISSPLYYKFTAKYVDERILKIGQYIAKLEANIQRHLFSGHGVYKPSNKHNDKSKSKTVKHATQVTKVLNDYTCKLNTASSTRERTNQNISVSATSTSNMQLLSTD